MNPGIDVIVVNYRTHGDLRGFVYSARQFPPFVPWSLVIVNVDPLSEDDDEALRLKGDVYIRMSDNVGYARAVNRASLSGDREVLAIFNADTRLTEGVLQECYEQLLVHEDWGVLGPRQVDLQGKLTHGGIFGTSEHPRFRGWRKPDGPEYSDVQEAVTVAGSALFIKRAIWDTLTACPAYQEFVPGAEGALLPTRHYYEETYLNYHARAHGWKVIYYGSASMVHKWHQASPVGGFADRMMKESRSIFRAACDAHAIVHD